MKSIRNMKTFVVTMFMMFIVMSLQVTATEETTEISVTEAPTAVPTEAPTTVPTEAPTAVPTETPTTVPTEAPTAVPTEAPTTVPTEAPTAVPTEAPTVVPTEAPTTVPTEAPTVVPTETPTMAPTEAPIEEVPILVTELDLGDYSEKMTVGTKQLLYVTVLPQNATDTALVYSSSDEKVAIVNGLGRITAKALGKTTITVTAGEISQCFELQVVAEENTIIPVENIEIGNYESELEVDKTMTISGTVLPVDATYATITYTSSDPAIATVTSTGEVKGIRAGKVVITLSAGGISKTAALTVKVPTTSITLNSDYLTLRPEDIFQLSAEVLPKELSQKVSYKSVDTSVATVSETGLVTGIGAGTTMIMVSNEDVSVAVSVIVNQVVNYNQQESNLVEDKVMEVSYADTIFAGEQSVIDSQMLKYFYETKQTLTVVGEQYTLEIAGENIVNCNNEMNTDIFLKSENGISSFTLNQGSDLCGTIKLSLETEKGKHLYLYNESKEKYEEISVENWDELILTTAGRYQIRDDKLEVDMQVVFCGGAFGLVLLLVGIGVYIGTKKRYWFW